MTKRTSLPRFEVVLAGAFLQVLVLAVFMSPVLPLPDPLKQNLLSTRAMPSWDHPFGTDSLGRDVLSRLLFGGREVLLGSVLSLIVALIVGGIAGLAGGYLKGGFDRFAGAVADMLQSIPGITIMLAVLAVFSNNVYAAMAAFGVLMSGALFRIVRAATLAVAEETYIEAARLSGMRDLAIIFRHLVARLGPVLIVQTSIVLSLSLVNLIGLGVLGLGSRPPSPSWGSSLQEAGTSIFIAPWMLGPPAAMVALTILSMLVLGDYFQDRETARIGRGSVVTPTARRLEPVPVVRSATKESAVLSVRNLSVGIAAADKPLWLIDDVSFSVRAGETVGLVGESGAGKSVAARTALGLFPANALIKGTVELLGQELTTADVKTLSAIRGRKVGFIAQQPMTALDPAFTIGQLLTEAVRTLRGESKAKARASALQLLRDVQIRDPERVVKLYPHEISGGMAQRVGIALSLADNPELLIADEPTTALDVTVQREVLTLMRRLQKERGLALLLVTHDWGVVADMCDRVVTFYAGQVVEAAGVDDIFATPRHPYSIALRRADPHAQEPGSQLKIIEGQVPPPGAWPVGCHFQARCAEAGPECRGGAIDLVEMGDRSVRCVHAASEEARS